jgi:hypothetical protein
MDVQMWNHLCPSAVKNQNKGQGSRLPANQAAMNMFLEDGNQTAIKENNSKGIEYDW